MGIDGDAELRDSLARAVLKREARMGLAFFGCGVVAIALAFATAKEETDHLSGLSWLFIAAVALITVIGLARLIVSQSKPIGSTWLPFTDGQVVVQPSAGSRVQLLMITADNGRELSWDLFGAELGVQGESSFTLRVDHAGERLVARGLHLIGINYVPKTYGRRLYPWKMLRLRGTLGFVVRVSKQAEALEHRARLLMIEL